MWGVVLPTGAPVDSALRLAVGDRLVSYWLSAPSQSRELVGRLLLDGFSDSLSPSLRDAVHRPKLIESGAGEIISKVNDMQLTISVMKSLMKNDQSYLVFNSLKPALNVAGDLALREIIAEMNPDTHDEDRLIALSSLLHNFKSESVSPEVVLLIARNERLPAQVRMRAYRLAGVPLDIDSKALTLAGLRAADWDRNYAARDLIALDPNPELFLRELVFDDSISLERKKKIVFEITNVLKRANIRRAFF